jgi:hypothetical protein
MVFDSTAHSISHCVQKVGAQHRSTIANKEPERESDKVIPVVQLWRQSKVFHMYTITKQHEDAWYTEAYIRVDIFGGGRVHTSVGVEHEKDADVGQEPNLAEAE